jgi:hypothetical protein
VRRLLCSKGFLVRPVAIVWDMWRVLPALSHVTRLSRERTVRTAVQRLGRRWPILLPGGGYGCMFVVSSRSREGSNFSPINTLDPSTPDVLHAGVKRDPTKFSNSRNAGPHSTFLAAAPRSDA